MDRKLIGYRASAPAGIVATPLEATAYAAINSAITIAKLAQDRSDDVEWAEDWVAHLDPVQRAAAWQAMIEQGWKVVEVYG